MNSLKTLPFRTTILLSAAAWLPGCAAGVIGLIAGAASGGGDVKEIIPTEATVVTPQERQAGRVETLLKVTFDPDHDVEIESIEYSLTGEDGTFRDATPAPRFETDLVVGRRLETSDEFRSFVWNSHVDLDDLLARGVIDTPVSARTVLRVRVRNNTRKETEERLTQEFFLSNALVTTTAGGGAGDGLRATAASLLGPTGVSCTPEGQVLIVDTLNQRIRRVLRGAGGDTIDTVAGNGFRGLVGGFEPATSTGLDQPVAVAVESDGNFFTAENAQVDGGSFGVIRHVEAESGLISIFFEGFGSLTGLAIDGDTLYATDETDAELYAIHVPSRGVGTIDSGEFEAPTGVAALVANSGTVLFVSDDDSSNGATTGYVVRRVQNDRVDANHVAGGGDVDPFASDINDVLGSLATDLRFDFAAAVATSDSHLFVSDRDKGYVVAVELTDFTVTNVIDDDGEPLARPTGLALGENGDLFISETGEDEAGDGVEGHRVIRVTNADDFLTMTIEAFAGTDSPKDSTQEIGGVGIDQTPLDFSTCSGFSSAGDDVQKSLDKIDAAFSSSIAGEVAATEASLARPEGLALDEANGRLFIADTGNDVVREVDLGTGLLRTVAGSGENAVSDTPQNALSVELALPDTVAIDPSRDELYISDTNGIHLLDLDTGQIRTFSTGEFARPAALLALTSGSDRVLVVADAGQNTGGSTSAPQVVIVDRTDATQTVTLDLTPGEPLRSILGLTGTVQDDGTVVLFVAVDVIDTIARDNANRNFEFDCFNGTDDSTDGDTDVDADDADCSESVQHLVFRVVYTPDGSGDITAGTVTASIAVRAYQKFPVVTFDDDCGGTPPDFPTIELEGLFVDGIATGSDGTLYVLDCLEEHVIGIDFSSGTPRSRVVAGTSVTGSARQVFDGLPPDETRFDRPSAIVVDRIDNLYISDRGNNRVRRAWVGF